MTRPGDWLPWNANGMRALIFCRSTLIPEWLFQARINRVQSGRRGAPPGRLIPPLRRAAGRAPMEPQGIRGSTVDTSTGEATCRGRWHPMAPTACAYSGIRPRVGGRSALRILRHVAYCAVSIVYGERCLVFLLEADVPSATRRYSANTPHGPTYAWVARFGAGVIVPTAERRSYTGGARHYSGAGSAALARGKVPARPDPTATGLVA